MQINSHGFEVDENEHDVVDKSYPELTPMLNPSRMVRILRNRAGDEHKFNCIDSLDWEIADYIEKLEQALKLYEAERIRFRHAKPEMTGAFFVSGSHGVRDRNQLPEYIQVCPAYGCDWSQVYVRTDRTIK